MIGTDNFKIKKDGYITWLIFNRPKKRNTMTPAFFSDLLEIFPQFDEDPDVRVIIIKGEGKSFTAGLDLIEAASLTEGDASVASHEKVRKNITKLQDSMSIIEKCRKPVIAAVHSHCIGGGVDLLCACDIRIASKDAVFSIRETKMAMVADLGTLQRLPTIVGQGWARELALTGRDFTAQEALQMGFITHICEDRDSLYARAGEIAEEIASCSPIAVQGSKDVIIHSRDNGVYPGLEFVAQKTSSLLPCEDVIEAFHAFMQKRPPRFTGK